MESDYAENYTLLEEADMISEEEREIYGIEDDLYPLHENGMYVFAETDGEFHLRKYIDSKVYILMDGWCRDLRPENERTAFWDEKTDFQWL